MRIFHLLIIVSNLTIVGLGTALAQPVLDEAFCVNFPTAGPNAGVPTHGEVGQWNGQGAPMVKVELTAPGAVCNDGTPGAMYLRPAPSMVADVANPAANHWVIHFKGGGGCKSFTSCRARWCADPAKRLNNPGLMSTAGTFLETNGTGILSQSAANPFNSWNHVLLYYCSSDSWLGDHDMGMAVSNHPEDAVLPNDHLIAFKGVAIVKAAFDRLLSSVPVTLPNGSGVQMPLLKNADLVLLSGDSAGANGARMHADHLSDVLRAANIPLGSDVPVLLTLDAGAAPLFDGGVLTWNATPTFPSYQDWVARVAQDSFAFEGITPAHLDQSCLALAVDPDYCYDFRYVNQNHITTPMFQRNDLVDTVANGVLIKLGLVATQNDYLFATEQDLHSIVPQQGPELRQDMAVFGPLCHKHVSIRNNDQFTQQIAVLGGLTYAAALSQWVQGCVGGTCPYYVEIAQPGVQGGGSTCP